MGFAQQNVFERIRVLSGKEQEEAAIPFVILSGIVGMEDEVKRRFKADLIDLMQNKILGPAIRQGLEQGRQLVREERREAGLQTGRTLERREFLQDLIEDRFGKIPAWAEAKLTVATPKTLKAWVHRFHRADSVEDVLAVARKVQFRNLSASGP